MDFIRRYLWFFQKYLYLALVGAVLALVIFCQVLPVIIYFVVLPVRSAFLRFVKYPVLVRRRKFSGATRLEGLFIFLYLTANVTAIVLFVKGPTDANARAGFVALVNLALMYLGGRTSPIADMVGIPLSTYYVMHHWAGRVVVLEVVIHLAVVCTRRRARHDWQYFSGYLAGCCLFLIFLSSLWLFRKSFPRLFSLLHITLAFGLLVGLLWHVSFLTDLRPKVPVFAAVVLWVLVNLYRVARTLRYGIGTEIIDVSFNIGGSKDSDLWNKENMTRVTLKVHRPVSIQPGAYFNVYFPGRKIYGILTYSLYKPFPLMVAWYEPRKLAESSGVTELVFLISNEGLKRRYLNRLVTGGSFLLDGPYGVSLKLHDYETVVLTAKGVGIIGLIPLALNILERRMKDKNVKLKASTPQDLEGSLYRDTIRRLDIIWRLESHDQQEWVADELKALQGLDPENQLLNICCLYPSPQEKPKPFQTGAHYQCLYPQEAIADEEDLAMSQQIAFESSSPGNCVVASCGDPLFIGNMRKAVAEHTRSSRAITFFEVEYRPNQNPIPNRNNANSQERKAV